MSATKRVVITCDVTTCDAEFAATAGTVLAARQEAEVAGWIVQGGKQQKDICPECNARLFGAEEASSVRPE